MHKGDFFFWFKTVDCFFWAPGSNNSIQFRGFAKFGIFWKANSKLLGKIAIPKSFCAAYRTESHIMFVFRDINGAGNFLEFLTSPSPLPPCRQFFNTIHWQFSPIFDPSHHSNCQCRLWVAPYWIIKVLNNITSENIWYHCLLVWYKFSMNKLQQIAEITYLLCQKQGGQNKKLRSYLFTLLR